MRPRIGRFTLAFRAVSKRLGAALIGAALWAGPVVGADHAPARVVSINLCTDQMAMLLAAPGQLVSVSHIALDPLASAMADKARAYPINHGQAEEVFGLAPDLVLAGTYSNPYTVGLLRRLGVEVVQFAPEPSFHGIRANLRAMGATLGRSAEAEALITRFDADLAALSAPKNAPRPRALLHYADNFTSGTETLADEILTAAGLANAAAEAGFSTYGAVALERLVMLAPDIIISGASYPGASRAEEVMRHPAMAALRARSIGTVVSDAEWVCGTPYTLNAVARLAALREAMP